MKTIVSAVRAVKGSDFPGPNTLAQVFTEFFPRISLAEREAFLEELLRLGCIDESRLAHRAGLYLTSKQIGGLVSYGFEIGNHTYTHVHCRSLAPEEMSREIDRNKLKLESLSGRQVRAFSVPYGSSEDLTAELAEHLQRTGHKAVFFSGSVANERGADRFHLDRVSAHAESDAAFFAEVELFPRLRALRDRYFSRPSAVKRAAAVA
jgi:peptidoglycan/xylan/chitin deacetylase (PgdA/CDA1 family)